MNLNQGGKATLIISLFSLALAPPVRSQIVNSTTTHPVEKKAPVNLPITDYNPYPFNPELPRFGFVRLGMPIEWFARGAQRKPCYPVPEASSDKAKTLLLGGVLCEIPVMGGVREMQCTFAKKDNVWTLSDVAFTKKYPMPDAPADRVFSHFISVYSKEFGQSKIADLGVEWDRGTYKITLLGRPIEDEFEVTLIYSVN